MEGIAVSVYRGLKGYGRRRGYQRLSYGSGRRRKNKVELGTTRNRRGRFWRWRIKISPKIRITRIPSPKKLLVWLRDAYVRMMLSIGNSRMMSLTASASGYGGGGEATFITAGMGRAPTKEYDEKMIIQIYKSLMMAQGQLVPRDAAKIDSAVDCRR